ncbi:hypothetical protein P3X46_017239 [Hevea brasiliensis]|uniref:C2H2-type domain-containing protein n=1 Tax=Hevea brasiliensis TaxID=3981 RepID=A0ABQ9M1M0_HEVBR|nr:uncharacterized protein LOC110664078 [Hevea brasiliensis]KAJ9174184.1 hypothetical protein P3X46_017239 [Hevea brasiliensis]
MEPKKKLFICKFCDKRFPCGKSLGGHIRIHFNGNGNGNSIDVEEEEMKLNASKSFAAANGSNSKRDSEVEAVAQSGYGLRENPKKTRRFMVDSSNNSFLQEKVCKECGKGFQSLKALCGHMACHSKNSYEDHSETTEKLKDQVMDSQSDTETSTPGKRRRCKRMRYNTAGVYSSLFSLANGSLSSASDIEQEQEEVAMCLMMLSKDSGFKGCFSSFADSSDNNSVVLETKSSSPKMKISVKNGVNNGNGILEMKKAKLQEMVSIENDHSENSDYGCFRNRLKRVESDISVHVNTGKNEMKKHKVEYGSRFEEDFDPELGKRLSRFRRIKMELRKDLVEEDRYDEADRASMKYDSRKNSKNDAYNPEFLSSSATKTASKCPPVGGYKTHHKKTNTCSDRVYESGENMIETECVPSKLPSSSKMSKFSSGKNPIEKNWSGNSEKKLGMRKGKVHECPFCFKVFRSGQALGGHKRSHFVGGAEDRNMVINQEVPEISMSGLIDLNLPAPMEEDANGYYIPTW